MTPSVAALGNTNPSDGHSSTLRDSVFFHNLAHMSRKTDDDFYENFATDVSLAKEVSVKF